MLVAFICKGQIVECGEMVIIVLNYFLVRKEFDYSDSCKLGYYKMVFFLFSLKFFFQI